MKAENNESTVKVLSEGKRTFFGIIAAFIPVLIISCAIALPFSFESSTVFYKFGFDKILLRSGKIIGLMTGCFILFQGVLSARFKFLDRIFGLNNLMNYHRICGSLIAGLALTHPVLIMGSEGLWTLPLRQQYWPEFVGVFLLMCIIGIVIAGNFRSASKLPFHIWRVAHRWGVFLAALALFVHVSFVSETFESGLPRFLIYSVLGLYFSLFLWVRLKAWGIGKTHFKVISVQQAGTCAYKIVLKQLSGKPFNHAPGQFGFFQFKSLKISREEHPFTLASSPAQPENIELVVRESGDWTRQIKNLEPGDTCLMDGPYGLFTHLAYDRANEVIMIAGGIGITPMLSMLRYMASYPEIHHQQRIILIWSNRTHHHIILPEEFNHLKSKVKGLHIFHVITRDPQVQGQPRRLDQRELHRIVSNVKPSAHFFICGPPKMMKDVCLSLKQIGFPKSKIHTEKFSL